VQTPPPVSLYPHPLHLPGARESSASLRGRFPGEWTARVARFLIAASPLLLAGCGPDRHAPVDARSVTALFDERFTAGRLAAQTEWHACAAEDRSVLVVRSRCSPALKWGSPGYERLADATADARSRLGSDSSSSALHARALLELRWHEGRPERLDRAVDTLQAARRALPRDPDVLNDLAVAYLAVGERDGRLRPVLRALETVEEALAADPAHLAALFNRALILDRLYLAASARRAWMQYLSRERDPAWQREAGERLRAATAVAQPPADDRARWLEAGADPAAVASFVRREPAHAREFGFRVLGEWGLAVARRDSDRASRLLALAGEIAAAQDSLAGDRSVAEAVALLTSSGLDDGRRRGLAAAHVQFHAGFLLFSDDRFQEAVAPLARAEREFRALGAPTARWADFYRAASQVSLLRYDDGDRALQRVLAEAQPSEPALAGKALLALGLSQHRRGNYERATELYRDAVPYVARAREPETAGHAAYLLAEGLLFGGQATAGEEEAYRGLRLLSAFRRSNHLNNHLARVADVSRGAGLSRAALAIMGEVLEVAPELDKPDVLALAFRERARDLTAVGRPAEAEADLRAAEHWAERIPPEGARGRIRGAVLLTRGEIKRRSDPGAALPILSAAVETFRRSPTDPYLPVALYEGALAAGAVGERALARGWIREAVGATERQQARFRASQSRAAFAETVEKVSDLMISTELADGRADTAFTYLERARLAAWPATALERGRPPAPDVVRAALPADMLLAEYAVLDDRLVVWSVARHAWHRHVVEVSRDSLRALVARLPDELATAATPRSAPALAKLYDLLLRPLGPAFPAARRVVVVPDRELHGVPFTALLNRDDGRYAVEAHEFGTVPSAAFLLTALSHDARVRGAGAPLVIGDPAIDSVLAAQLGRLPGAEREAMRVARLYPGSTLLVGPQAVRGRVVDLLPGASLVHFAGHAVFDADRPERSYLALASREVGGGRLRAAEIGKLRLSKVEVVVLSACSTMNPRPSRAGGVAGLAYSFLHAGAPATISTLWDVSDGDVVELLVTFHRAMKEGRTPSEALHRAQLQALRSQNQGVSAPRTWAAFTYTGR